MNKKLIAMILATVMVASTVPVLASADGIVIGGGTVSTGATVPLSAGDPPVVKAKWEAVDYDTRSINPGNPSTYVAIDTSDDDPTLPGTQVNPPMEWGETVTLEYCVVVMDPDGKGNIIEAYVDVYHPDGSFKYEVPLEEVPTVSVEQRQAASNLVQSASDNGILAINEAEGFTLAEVKDEVLENSAKLFCGKADLDYHQMCGEYEWCGKCTGTCPGTGCECTGLTPVSGYAYTASAFGVDVEGSGRIYFDNNFEYICSAGIELDFDSINWENVKAWSLDRVINTKWVEGNYIFDEPVGPACKGTTDIENCRPPTVRNIGNTPVYLGVAFDDMGFGKAGDRWNVDFDASMKENAEVVMDPVSMHSLNDCSDFNPACEDMTTLPDSGLEPEPYCEEEYGVLDLCDTEKMTFSIHVYKSPVSGGSYQGCTLIEPIPMDFPWWECEQYV